MTFQKSSLALVGLLTFSAATLVGWKSTGESTYDTSPAPYESLSSRGDAGPAGNRDHGMGNLRSQRLEQDRMRSAIEMARSLPSCEIRAWLDQGKFNQRKGYAMTLFEKIAFERWAKEEPIEFLGWLAENGGSGYDAQLRAIATDHPEAISEAIAGIKNPSERAQLMYRLASSSPELALTEFWNLLPLPTHELNSYESFLKEIGKNQLAPLEKMLGELIGPSHTMVENIIYGRKLVEDFDRAFDEIIQLPNGFDRFMGDYSLARSLKLEDVLDRLADFPPDWKAKFAADPRLLTSNLRSNPTLIEKDWAEFGFSEVEIKSLAKRMFSYSVQTGPETSFPLLDQQGFTDEEKQELLKSSIPNIRDEDQRNTLIASLTNPDDRAYFEEVLAKKDTASSSSTPLSPADLLGKMTGSEGLLNSSWLGSQMRNWTPEQKGELMESYRNLEGETKTQVSTILSKGSRGISSEFREEAIVHLLSNAETQNIEGWNQENSREAQRETSEHVVDLMNSDPGKASAWVESLPDGSARLQAKQNLALNWGNYEPEAAQKWIATQSAVEREAITGFLKSKQR